MNGNNANSAATANDQIAKPPRHFAAKAARKYSRKAKYTRPANARPEVVNPASMEIAPRRTPAETRNGKPTLSGLIRGALSGGPKDLAEIIAAVQKQDAGIEVDDRKVSNAVYQLVYTKALEKVGGKYALASPGGEA